MHLLAGHGITYIQVCQVAVYIWTVQLAWKPLVLLSYNVLYSVNILKIYHTTNHIIKTAVKFIIGTDTNVIQDSYFSIP